MTPTNSAQAQQHLDQLKAEQRALPDALADARRAGDPATWLQLEARREDLDDALTAAQVAVYTARLAEAWETAEAAVQVEQETREKRDQTRTTRDVFQALTPSKEGYEHDKTKRAQQLVENCGAALHAASQFESAHKATISALAQIDDLEDAIELLTGQRPEGGQGLRAVPPPAATHLVKTHPTRPAHPPVHVYAGERPPRWFAHTTSSARREQPLTTPRAHTPPDARQSLVSAPTAGGYHVPDLAALRHAYEEADTAWAALNGRTMGRA